MLLLCNRLFTNMLKGVLEVMLDGSERARIRITPECIEFQSVDSLNVCVCLCQFKPALFERYEVEEEIAEPFTVHFNLRKLYSFLKKLNGHTMFTRTTQSTLRLHVLSRYNPAASQHTTKHFLTLDNTPDATQYSSIAPSHFQHWSSFTINPEEYTGIILDLAISGGYIDMRIGKDVVEFTAECETGKITTSAHTSISSDFQIHRSGTGQYNRYLTKFLKQACTISQSCTALKVFMMQHGPLVLEFTLENNTSKLHMSIAPAAGQK